MISYIYQHANESTRQSSQAKIMHEESMHLLYEAGLRPGISIVDLGCGTAQIDFSIASILGPAGKILGVDADPGLINLNRHRERQSTSDNLFFRIGIAERYTDIFQYDITFARFLLAHSSSPLKLLENMLNLTKYNGHIALEDVDIKTMRAVPHSPELEALNTLISTLSKYCGGDASIGPQLGNLLYLAGLKKVQLFSHQPAGSSGPLKQVPLHVLNCIQPALLRFGLATAEQLDRLAEGLKELAADTDTTLYFPRIYQAIGLNNHTLKQNFIRSVPVL